MKRQNQKLSIPHACALSLGVMLLALGCSTPRIESYPTLVNQGILPLSSDNAYVGANLFLAKEAQQCAPLYQFLLARGAPHALEIREREFDPTQMMLYYPGDRVLYAAELIRRKAGHEWIVRGPYAMDRREYQDLGSLVTRRSQPSEPLFVIDGRPFHFRQPAIQEKRVVSLDFVAIPTPTPKKVVKKPKVSTAQKTPEAPPAGHELSTPPVPTNFQNLNTDQRALLVAKGYAWRDANGDILHTVKGVQTLAEVAKWYTGSDKNSGAIAHVNTITEGTVPEGRKVRIPLALIQEGKQMPAGVSTHTPIVPSAPPVAETTLAAKPSPSAEPVHQLVAAEHTAQAPLAAHPPQEEKKPNEATHSPPPPAKPQDPAEPTQSEKHEPHSPEQKHDSHGK